jgi:cytochrome c oxidase subunit 4
MTEHAPRTSNHVVPVGTYVAVFLSLIALTVITVVASRLSLGAFNTPIALAIAVTKALLVIFFMHVKYSPKLIWLVVAAAFFWLFHLIAGTSADYLSRDRINAQDRPKQPFSLEDR